MFQSMCLIIGKIECYYVKQKLHLLLSLQVVASGLPKLRVTVFQEAVAYHKSLFPNYS